MGLRDTIAKSVKSAFTAIGDIAETVTYKSVSEAEYDVYTGQVENTGTEYSVKAVVSSFGSASVDAGLIESGVTADYSVLLSSSGLQFTPDTNDIVIKGGKEYKVKQIIQDPVEATYRLIIGRLG